MRIFARRMGQEHSDPAGHAGRRGDREPHGVPPHRRRQKKVEERNFDIRKNLLEYDEVMDEQRKRVYGWRQEILNGLNCKTAIRRMIDEQIDEAVDRYLDDEFGAASFAEFAGNRFGVDFEPHDFRRSSFEEADKTAHDKALKAAPTFIQEALDECLPQEEDASTWKWQELARRANARYGLKLSDRELRQVGPENLSSFFMEKASAAIEAVDLQDGAKYLGEEWSLRSICDWMKQKFLLKVTSEELAGKNAADIKSYLHAKVLEQYRKKEAEFPVTVAMANYMAERPAAQGGRNTIARACTCGPSSDSATRRTACPKRSS